MSSPSKVVESRIEHLLKEDVTHSLKKEWFKGLAPLENSGLGNWKWKTLNFTTIRTSWPLKMNCLCLWQIWGVIQAFVISNEAQRLQELQLILESILKKNKLPCSSLGVKWIPLLTHHDWFEACIRKTTCIDRPCIEWWDRLRRIWWITAAVMRDYSVTTANNTKLTTAVC